MVFGHHCVYCDAPANIHHSERDKGVWVVDEWRCVACDSRIFEEHMKKVEAARLQRFQASGSDAPAPVPMYERD